MDTKQCVSKNHEKLVCGRAVQLLLSKCLDLFLFVLGICSALGIENCMSKAEYKATVAGTVDMTSPYVGP